MKYSWNWECSSPFLLKLGIYCHQTKRKLTGVEVYTNVITGSGETSSLLLWLFPIFIGRVLNVKCGKSPKSKDQSPNLSQGVRLPFAFHCPQSCISSSKTILKIFFLYPYSGVYCQTQFKNWLLFSSQDHTTMLWTQFLSRSLQDMINLCTSVWQHLLFSSSFWIQQKKYKILSVDCFLCKKD